jgi:hypothetical protein
MFSLTGLPSSAPFRSSISWHAAWPVAQLDHFLYALEEGRLTVLLRTDCRAFETLLAHQMRGVALG